MVTQSGFYLVFISDNLSVKRARRTEKFLVPRYKQIVVDFCRRQIWTFQMFFFSSYFLIKIQIPSSVESTLIKLWTIKKVGETKKN